MRKGKVGVIGLQPVNHFVHLEYSVFMVECVVTG